MVQQTEEKEEREKLQIPTKRGGERADERTTEAGAIWGSGVEDKKWSNRDVQSIKGMRDDVF
jgi:hypothetical protein